MSDHHRTSPQGRQLGRNMIRMAELGFRRLAFLPTLRDDRCASCAFREGTVPNGCLQTQLDVLKAVVEGVRFCCHAPRDGRLCAGYVAARAEQVANPMPSEVEALVSRWQYSPPDEPAP